MSIPHQTIDAVRRRLDEEHEKGKVYEYVFLPMIVVLFTTGVGLLVFASFQEKPLAACSGGGCLAVLFWPIRTLLNLHAKRVNLGKILALLAIADDESKQKMVYEMMATLIKQVNP